MDHLRTQKLIYSALFMAIAMVLPFLTGQIPDFGAMLCPMHIPVLLCGFICGWNWGLAVGFISPLMRSVIFGMPKFMPTAVAMAFELAVYGLVTGIMYRLLPKKRWCLYVSLVSAMILGRIVWGIVQYFICGMMNVPFTMNLFISGAILTAIPGIILQIILIPVLVRGFERADLMLN